MERSPLGEFLTARRASLSPADVGLPTGRRRRVRGLRREEVSSRAGLSVEYYTSLEQGKARNPSPEALRALAAALQLTDAQTRYLHSLASSRFHGPVPERGADSHLGALLHDMRGVAAFVYNHRTDIIAWNDLFARVCFDPAAVPVKDRNIARFDFLNPASRDRLADWESVCRSTAGQLRLAAAQYPTDTELAHLIGELMLGSQDFRNHWQELHVDLRSTGVKRFNHPVVGALTLGYTTLDVPCSHVSEAGQIGHRLLILHPTDPESRDALQLIELWDDASTPSAPPRGRVDHTDM